MVQVYVEPARTILEGAPNMHTVTIAAGLTNVSMPNGFSYDGGDLVRLTDEEYALLSTSASPTYVLSDGNGIQNLGGSLYLWTVPFALASITAANLNSMTPGWAGEIKSIRAVCTTPASTAAKAATVTPKINSTSTTGGAVALTTATHDTVGEIVNGSSITAANTFDADDVLHLTGSSVTAFVEGATVFEVLLLKS